MGAKISRIEYYLPGSVLSNEDLVDQHPEWNPQKVEKKVGIRNRHIALPEETALDMAVKAAEKLFVSVDPNTLISCCSARKALIIYYRLLRVLPKKGLG